MTFSIGAPQLYNFLASLNRSASNLAATGEPNFVEFSYAGVVRDAVNWHTTLLQLIYSGLKPPKTRRWERACRYAALQGWSPRLFELNLWRHGIDALAAKWAQL